MTLMFICQDLGYELPCLHDILMSLSILPWPWCSFLNDLLTLLILIKNVRNIGAVHLYIENELNANWHSLLCPLKKSLKVPTFAIWMWWLNSQGVKNHLYICYITFASWQITFKTCVLTLNTDVKKLLLRYNTTFQN